MPPKASAPKAKAAPVADKVSYQDMIKDAIVNLKERSGSSRIALKKYVKANNKQLKAEDKMFDSIFNKAIRTGVEQGVFTQPKGASGPVKLAQKPVAPKEPKAEKKVAAKPAAKPAAAKKATTTKKAAAKPKAATKAKAAAPKKAAPKTKAPAEAKVAAKPAAKAAAKPKVKKVAAPKDAPAVVDKPTVLSKTKSGRVTKTTAPSPKAKKAAPKKAAAKKATPKKATPKKATPKKA